MVLLIYTQTYTYYEMSRRRVKGRPSFFKILLSDYTRLLRLPPDFVQKYESVLPENVKLCIPGCGGRTWKVKLDGEHHCLTRGWNKFVKDVGLEIGEFLVFKMTAWAVFRVSVYSINGCKREFWTQTFDASSGSEEEEVVEEEENGDADDETSECSKNKMKNKRSMSDHQNSVKFEDKGPLYFEFLLKKHQASRITLPRRFGIATRLERQELHKCVMLEYLPGHRQVLVNLDHRETWRTDLTIGWGKFRKQNGIVLGRTYSFEFKPQRNVIQVMEVAKRTNHC